jgi:hypothetical protein
VGVLLLLELSCPLLLAPQGACCLLLLAATCCGWCSLPPARVHRGSGERFNCDVMHSMVE